MTIFFHADFGPTEFGIVILSQWFHSDNGGDVKLFIFPRICRAEFKFVEKNALGATVSEKKTVKVVKLVSKMLIKMTFELKVN